MLNVRISQPSLPANQSAVGRTLGWVLEYEPATQRQPEPMMGWVSSGDTLNQIRLCFQSKGDAVAYAERNGLTYTVQETAVRNFRVNSYIDKFKVKRGN
ncbi:MAG: ETC complex I subunit [Rhodospirillaceae bacterium]